MGEPFRSPLAQNPPGAGGVGPGVEGWFSMTGPSDEKLDYRGLQEGPAVSQLLSARKLRDSAAARCREHVSVRRSETWSGRHTIYKGSVDSEVHRDVRGGEGPEVREGHWRKGLLWREPQNAGVQDPNTQMNGS